MAYENNHDFTDWLYNRYVVALRKNDYTRMIVFSDVLNQYVIKVLSQRKFSKQKRHAKELLKTIEKAHKNETIHKLLLTGDEGKQEFEKAMADYEAMLREMDFSEETITELVIEKRFNYGND